MSTLSLRLPNSLHRELKSLARQEGISINQLITTAVAEKMSALMTADYFEKRRVRGSRAKFEGALAHVSSRLPAEDDTLTEVEKSQK